MGGRATVAVDAALALSDEMQCDEEEKAERCSRRPRSRAGGDASPRSSAASPARASSPRSRRESMSRYHSAGTSCRARAQEVLHTAKALTSGAERLQVGALALGGRGPCAPQRRRLAPSALTSWRLSLAQGLLALLGRATKLGRWLLALPQAKSSLMTSRTGRQNEPQHGEGDASSRQ